MLNEFLHQEDMMETKLGSPETPQTREKIEQRGLRGVSNEA